MTTTSRVFQPISAWMLALLVLAPVATAQDGPAAPDGPEVIEPDGGDRLWGGIGAEPGREPQPLPPEEFAALAAEHDLILRPPEPQDD